MSQYVDENDSVLRITFDFENFLRNSGLNDVLVGYNTSAGASSTSAFDFRSIQLAMRSLGDTFDNMAESSSIDLFLPKVPEILFDICFDSYFVPYLSSEYRQSFNNLNVSHTTDLKKRLLYLVEAANEIDIFKNSTATDLKPDYGPITALPSATFFSFGQALYNLTSEFNADAFKSKIAPVVLKSFLPMFYYQYLQQKLAACGGDQAACKRSFALGRLVFVYYAAMSIFLIVFSSPETVKRYKAVTNDNDAILKERKERLLRLMDAILIKLGDQTLSTASDGQRPAELVKFYDSVKQLSLNNVKESNDLTRLKEDIQKMQSNLTSYNQMEALNARNVFMMKIMFWVAVVASAIVLLFVVGLTLVRRFAIAEILSSTAIVACLVAMWLNHTRLPGDGGSKTSNIVSGWLGN